MRQFFIEGGIVFMSILTLLFLLILGLSTTAGISAFRKANSNPEKAKSLLGYVKSISLFALVFAVFGQIMGLVDIFGYLANKDANVASSILAQGIKLTFHSTLYGLIIYLVSILITLGIQIQIKRIET
ncbi:MAG: MotA/TolQ/ExbB proton channel family protein [Bacteroidales bacterium]|nr:MotA/TolQ/ExbB proton channel family protein [Bacteroidales bacterium]